MARLVLYIFLMLMFTTPIFDAYKILFMLPFGSKSHKNVFDPVTEELAKRGHEITLFHCLEDKTVIPGVRSYSAQGLVNIFERNNISFFQGSGVDFSFLNRMFETVYEMINLTYSDPLIVDLLNEPMDRATGKPKFDLLVMDACFNDFVLPIAHHLGIPSIIFSPGHAFTNHAWNLNVPYPWATTPTPTSDFPEPFSFSHRALNSLLNGLFILTINYYVYPNEDQIIRQFLPNAPPILDLTRNVSFMIANSHPPISIRKPSMPYAVEIGGLNCHPAKPLPKDLEEFLQQSGEDGTIYFSLGSVTKGESMPLEMRDKVIAAFAQLPQKILWKYEKDIPNLPKNIKLIKWAPQQDLLGHPQVKLFISHGGGLSTSEAAYHGCPILGFPLSADQEGNMAQAKRQGCGEYLNWRTFTTQELVDSINKMLHDKNYREKVRVTSVLLQDRYMNPVEEAAYWIEYVIRHKGAPFLKSSADALYLYQYFLLDVFAVFGLVVILIVTISACILRCSLKFICRKLGINCSKCCVFGKCSKENPKTKKSLQNKKNK